MNNSGVAWLISVQIKCSHPYPSYSISVVLDTAQHQSLPSLFTTSYFLKKKHLFIYCKIVASMSTMRTTIIELFFNINDKTIIVVLIIVKNPPPKTN